MVKGFSGNRNDKLSNIKSLSPHEYNNWRLHWYYVIYLNGSSQRTFNINVGSTGTNFTDATTDHYRSFSIPVRELTVNRVWNMYTLIWNGNNLKLPMMDIWLIVRFREIFALSPEERRHFAEDMIILHSVAVFAFSIMDLIKEVPYANPSNGKSQIFF
ncbi:MAG: hypothetical protein D6732_27370 [Methanobacteriota archaeon]|nr:MAG: hypothetical protein D6732_27370 [Euryarchaeota archaeon]